MNIIAETSLRISVLGTFVEMMKSLWRVPRSSTRENLGWTRWYGLHDDEGAGKEEVSDDHPEVFSGFWGK